MGWSWVLDRRENGRESSRMGRLELSTISDRSTDRAADWPNQVFAQRPPIHYILATHVTRVHEPFARQAGLLFLARTEFGQHSHIGLRCWRDSNVGNQVRPVSLIGVYWLFRNFRESLPLRRVKNAVAQQVKAGTTKHSSLDHFETIDMALGLAIAPRRRERHLHGCLVAPQALRQVAQFLDAGLLGIGEPEV